MLGHTHELVLLFAHQLLVSIWNWVVCQPLTIWYIPVRFSKFCDSLVLLRFEVSELWEDGENLGFVNWGVFLSHEDVNAIETGVEELVVVDVDSMVWFQLLWEHINHRLYVCRVDLFSSERGPASLLLASSIMAHTCALVSLKAVIFMVLSLHPLTDLLQVGICSEEITPSSIAISVSIVVLTTEAGRRNLNHWLNDSAYSLETLGVLHALRLQECL